MQLSLVCCMRGHLSPSPGSQGQHHPLWGGASTSPCPPFQLGPGRTNQLGAVTWLPYSEGTEASLSVSSRLRPQHRCESAQMRKLTHLPTWPWRKGHFPFPGGWNQI